MHHAGDHADGGLGGPVLVDHADARAVALQRGHVRAAERLAADDGHRDGVGRHRQRAKQRQVRGRELDRAGAAAPVERRGEPLLGAAFGHDVDAPAEAERHEQRGQRQVEHRRREQRHAPACTPSTCRPTCST